jgi:fumarylpyruvate hydrolase
LSIARDFVNSTDTPAGVGPVIPGDVMVGAVEGLGTLTIAIGDKAR